MEEQTHDINALETLAAKFATLKQTRNDIQTLLEEILQKLNHLHKIYQQFVRTHADRQFVFGLDTFHFQNKLIELEHESLMRTFHAIDNRMYCEYYKLYRMMQEYVQQDIKDPKLLDKLSATKKTYPVYKDLEPFKVYPFQHIIDLQGTMFRIVGELNKYIQGKTEEIKREHRQSKLGLNIDNIVNIQLFQNKIIEERIHMFIRYLRTFHIHHIKYLSRLVLKCKLMVGVVNEDIQLQCLQGIATAVPLNTATMVMNNNEEDSDNGAATTTPPNSLSSMSSRISRRETANIKHLIDYTTSSEHVQSQLDNILALIPPSAASYVSDAQDVGNPDELDLDVEARYDSRPSTPEVLVTPTVTNAVTTSLCGRTVTLDI